MPHEHGCIGEFSGRSVSYCSSIIEISSSMIRSLVLARSSFVSTSRRSSNVRHSFTRGRASPSTSSTSSAGLTGHQFGILMSVLSPRGTLPSPDWCLHIAPDAPGLTHIQAAAQPSTPSGRALFDRLASDRFNRSSQLRLELPHPLLQRFHILSTPRTGRAIPSTRARSNASRPLTDRTLALTLTATVLRSIPETLAVSLVQFFLTNSLSSDMSRKR